MNTDSHANTASVLKRMKTGHRAWFWFCTEIQEGGPVLLLSSLRKDPLLESLRKTASQIQPANDGSVATGLLTVTAAGVVQFVGNSVREEHLVFLSKLVSDHVELHQEFAIMKDAEMMRTDEYGTIVEHHRDSTLWEHIQKSTVSGTIEDTAERLAIIPANRDFWFWMTENGPDGLAFLLLGSPKRDPDGKQFAAKISEIRNQVPESPKEISGIARKGEQGMLLFSTQQPVEIGQKIARKLIADHATLRTALKDLRIGQMSGGKFIRIASIFDDDKSPFGQTLMAVDNGETVWFCFGSGEGGGLHIDRDQSRVKAAMKSMKSKNKTRGQLVRAARGWLEFQCRTPYPGFLRDLIKWAYQSRNINPDVIQLRGARMTQVGKGGEVLDQQKNDKLWGRIDS